MKKPQNDDEQMLNTENKPQKYKSRNIGDIIVTKTSNKNQLLFKLIIIIVAALVLFQIKVRLDKIAAKQDTMKQLITSYSQTYNSLRQRFTVINASFSESLKEEQIERLYKISENINKIQSKIKQYLPQKKQYQQSKLDQIHDRAILTQKTVYQRQMLIRTFHGHIKDIFRKKRIDFLTQNAINKKQKFSQEKIRNPWAMNPLNLRTIYIDTLEKRHLQQQMQKQQQRLNQKYHFHLYPKQLPLCVVVTGRNNLKDLRYQHSLQSIINQKYDNYKLIVVDDASTDGTGDLIQLFLKKSKLPKQKWILQKNVKRMGAIYNINWAIKKHCKIEDIAVLVSGDDQLLGTKVFKVLNVVYQTKNPGAAYTNHFWGNVNEKWYDPGYSKRYEMNQLRNRQYRFTNQKFGHIRTFLVQLFYLIKQENMRYKDGTWLLAASDQCFMQPILQMSCDCVEYIDEYFYIYNYGHGSNDGMIHPKQQEKAVSYVRSLPKYPCLQKFQKYTL